jgi:glycosyltransferase involved in cell wall biosynthesis
MRTNLKLAIVASEMPFPPVSGCRMDIWNRIVALSRRGVSVHLITWVDEFVSEEHLKQINRHVDSLTVHRRNRTPLLALHPRYPTTVISRVLPRASYKADLKKLTRISPDVVFLDQLAGAVLALDLADDLNTPLVYRSHNVEYQYMKELFLAEQRLARKALLFTNIWRTKSVERLVRACSSRIFEISTEDRKAWQDDAVTAKARVLNYCLHLDSDFGSTSHRADRAIDVLYVGNLHTPNNIFGLEWFARRVAPLLRDSYIVVAGSNPARQLCETLREANIEVTANPHEVQSLYARARVLINPVWHGSGVNIKTVELLATGKPVVSTSAGTRGLARQLLRHVGVADNPEDFATFVLERLDDDFSPSQQGNVAREYGEENITRLIEDLQALSNIAGS